MPDPNDAYEWWFSIFFVAVGVIGFTMSLGNTISVVAEMQLERQMERLVRRGITVDMIDEMDIDGSGEVERIEFLQTMLVKWKRFVLHIILHHRRAQ